MIGILIPEFPSQTHIIFWREIAALRALGESVSIISTTSPDPKACLHDFAQPSRQETHYIYPPRLAVALKTLAARPLGAGCAVRYVLGLGQSTALERAKKLGYLLCAADLLDHCRRRGIEHLHVHSCAEAAHIAAITNILGGPPYSLTLHGDLPVYGKDHAKKMARAKFVATDGAHLKPQIVKHADYPESRVLPTFLGLDLGRFRCDLGARSREPNALRLTTVGRLDLCKGHRHALAAIRAAVDQGYDIRYTRI